MVAFLYIFETINRFLETTDRFGMLNEHTNKSSNVLAEPAGIEDRGVAANHPAFFEFVDALCYRRRGQSDALADACQRQLTVLLQEREDMAIKVVQFHDAF